MPPTVSILINNWNYAQYVGAAIDSALAQTYPKVEVIVVDDGSTDGSRAVLAAFAGRVTVITQSNAGQPAAAATGVAASSGNVIMFLDADDLLRPEAAARVMAVWTEECAKVQFRLTLIDRNGVRLGADPPTSIPMPNGDVIPTIVARGGYETPVTSGNAYPRWLIERVFPIPDDFHNIDGYLNTVTPFFGNVISIDEELGAYRQHGGNRWSFSDKVDVHRLRRRVKHDLVKERYLQQTAAATGRFFPLHTALLNPTHVLSRLASLRLEPSKHPLPGDTARGLVRAGLHALWTDRTLPWAERAFNASLLVTMAFGPSRVVYPTVQFAFLSRPRPQWVRALARAVRRVSSLGSASGGERKSWPERD